MLYPLVTNIQIGTKASPSGWIFRSFPHQLGSLKPFEEEMSQEQLNVSKHKDQRGQEGYIVIHDTLWEMRKKVVPGKTPLNGCKWIKGRAKVILAVLLPSNVQVRKTPLLQWNHSKISLFQNIVIFRWQMPGSKVSSLVLLGIMAIYDIRAIGNFQIIFLNQITMFFRQFWNMLSLRYV